MDKIGLNRTKWDSESTRWTDGLPEVVLDTLMKDPRSDIRRLVADILKLLLVDEILKFFRADPELAELAAPALHESDNADEWAAWYADSDDPSVREAWEALENDSMASMNDDVFYDALARSPGPKAA